MVRSFLALSLGLALLLGACAVTREQPVETRQKPGSEDSKQRSEQLFAELEGKQDAPAALTEPAKASGKDYVRISEASNPAPRPGETVVVEIDTFRVFNDSVSLRDAGIQTLSLVRELAMAKALPVDIAITSLTTSMYVERNARFDESAAKSIFMLSSSAGRFLSEEVLKREPRFDAGSHSLSYRIHYRAKILAQEQIYNPSLALQVKLSETFLQDAEQFNISVTPNADGYLYFFDFLSDSSVALVFPNQDLSDCRIKAGVTWEQPAVAVCDPDKDFTIETLYFVFSTEPISGWEEFRSNRNASDLVYSAGEDSFIRFQNWLAKSDPRLRLEKLAQIHIYR